MSARPPHLTGILLLLLAAYAAGAGARVGSAAEGARADKKKLVPVPGLTLESATPPTIIKTLENKPPSTRSYDPEGKPLIQLAMLLDTSLSMDGLINQARNQISEIVNEVKSSKKIGMTPVIEVAVYEYGNTLLNPAKNWIRQVLPFTRDLNRVTAELFRLKTAGGPEYCGQVIMDAVDELNWSPDKGAYKAIFIAGNEPFTQGHTDYRKAVNAASAKGIFVNTIFCGPWLTGANSQWREGARLSGGEYSNIDQNAPVTAGNTQPDARIAGVDKKTDARLARLNKINEAMALTRPKHAEHITKREKEKKTSTATLGSAMSDIVRQQAAKKGYVFDTVKN